MRIHLKPLRQQTIVITGATSGIGLTTAKMAASQGAAVVLAARDLDALRAAADDIQARGGRATYAAADVADADAVDRIADMAIREFGGFDTWVNNAGVSIYGRLDDVPLADKRRLFDVNFWGVVHGCRTAVRHLRLRGGGAVINLGSIVSDRAVPLQGIYSASKHAVKGYTDALRMELEKERVPIAVTLLKPTSIDTPFIDHARNYMAEKPTFPPPVYPPEEVARAILHCASHPVRDVIVGGGGRVLTAMGKLAPRLTDTYMKTSFFGQQQATQPPGPRRGSLYWPTRDGREEGSYEGRVMRSSAYTRAKLSPMRFVVPAAAAVLLAVLARR